MKRFALFCSLALWFGVPAHSANTTSSIAVTATVLASCTLSSTAMSFGTAIDPLTSPAWIDTTSTLTVKCTNTTGYTITMSAGDNAGAASFAGRQMKDGAKLLPYQIYTTSARSNVWGDGTDSSSPYSGTGDTSSQAITVYGRLPIQSTTAPGVYTDTVVVTLTY